MFYGVPNGTYLLVTRKANHVTRCDTVEVDGSSVQHDVTICPVGDASGDGMVDIADTGRIYAHVRQSNLLTDDYALDCADVNGDGSIDIADTAQVYAHVCGSKLLW